MTDQASEATPPTAGWRFKLGTALFLLSLIGPFIFIPLVAALGLSAALAASISGGILAGAEVVLIVAAAVMGKSGFAYIKSRVFGILRQYGPPAEVGRTRYTIGLVMFAVPMVFGWVAPYAADMVPGYVGNESTFAIAGDLLLLVSLFVLGGDFWDKLRALFVRGAKAVFPLSPIAPGETSGQ